MSRKDDLKAIIRDAPRIESVFAEVEQRLSVLAPEYRELCERRTALSAQLTGIQNARIELAASNDAPAKATPHETTGEPTPDPTPAAKPKHKGK